MVVTNKWREKERETESPLKAKDDYYRYKINSVNRAATENFSSYSYGRQCRWFEVVKVVQVCSQPLELEA